MTDLEVVIGEEPDWLAHERDAASRERTNGHDPLTTRRQELTEALQGWAPIDLAPVLAGDHTQPVPTILHTRDEIDALLYPGNVNGLHGDSGIGKTWLAFAAIAQTIQAGRHAILIDYEANPAEVVARLLALALSPEQIITRLTYIQPDTPTGDIAVAQILQQITDDTALVVIDSLGEAFGLDGIDENLDSEVGPWLRRVTRPLAAAGPAVVLVDHCTKAADNPLHPSGSKRKRAAITGASYLIQAKVAFTRTQPGVLSITCAKDRHGTYRRGEVTATADVTPYPDGGVTVNLHRAAPGETDTSTEILARVAIRALKDHGQPATSNVLVGLMGAKAKGAKDAKLAGIAVAVARGSIDVEPGPNRSKLHRYVKDLEDRTDALLDSARSPR